MTNKKSHINFDRTIAGFNFSEHGLKSYSKTFKLGPLSFTANVNGKNARGSLAIPGTGISFRNLLHTEIPSLDDMKTPDLPEYKEDEWTDEQ